MKLVATKSLCKWYGRNKKIDGPRNITEGSFLHEVDNSSGIYCFLTKQHSIVMDLLIEIIKVMKLKTTPIIFEK